MTWLSRIVLVLGGAVVGALATLTVVSDDEVSSAGSSIVSLSIKKQMSPVEHTGTSMAAPEERTVDPSTSPAQVDATNLPNTPPVYIEMLPPSRNSVSFEDLHWTFARETRHEAWAFAVEAEIAQDIVDNGVAKWAVVEHIECREMTCEVAGYLLGDSEIHPQEIVKGVDRSIWWHEQFSVHSMRGSAGGMKRFLIVITGQPFGDRIRPPRPLN